MYFIKPLCVEDIPHREKINNFGIRQFRKFSNFGIISDNPGQNHQRQLSHFTKIVKNMS